MEILVGDVWKHVIYFYGAVAINLKSFWWIKSWEKRCLRTMKRTDCGSVMNQKQVWPLPFGRLLGGCDRWTHEYIPFVKSNNCLVTSLYAATQLDMFIGPWVDDNFHILSLPKGPPQSPTSKARNGPIPHSPFRPQRTVWSCLLTREGSRHSLVTFSRKPFSSSNI